MAEPSFDDDFAFTDAGMSAIGKNGEWRSLNEVVEGACLFQNVDPNDLDQGSIGDCWLISAFSGFAEYPMAVRNCVKKSLFEEGKYSVCLWSYEEAAWQWIDVNDFVPCRDNGEPMFLSPTKENEIWPCILEKAFAKRSGGYDQIKGGNSSYAFGALVGCTDIAYYKQDGEGFRCIVPDYSEDTVKGDTDWNLEAEDLSFDDVFEALSHANKWNYLMCASSWSGSDTTFSDEGIVQGHAYSILDVRRNPDFVSGVNLLRVRNPWGRKEWNGAWSDGSEEWDNFPMVATLLPHEEADDGLFWISWEDFLDQFKGIYICRKNMGEVDGPFGLPNPFVLLKSYIMPC